MNRQIIVSTSGGKVIAQPETSEDFKQYLKIRIAGKDELVLACWVKK